jgi:DNA-binding NarL/FixJ family response regulator
MSEDSDGRPLRVLVAEEDELVRNRLRAVLASAGLEVVAVASGEGALLRNRSFAVDVVVMADDMPGMSGVEATRRLVQEAPATSVLTLADAADDARVPGCRARGQLRVPAEGR